MIPVFLLFIISNKAPLSLYADSLPAKKKRVVSIQPFAKGWIQTIVVCKEIARRAKLDMQ